MATLEAGSVTKESESGIQAPATAALLVSAAGTTSHSCSFGRTLDSGRSHSSADRSCTCPLPVRSSGRSCTLGCPDSTAGHTTPPGCSTGSGRKSGCRSCSLARIGRLDCSIGRSSLGFDRTAVSHTVGLLLCSNCRIGCTEDHPGHNLRTG